MTEEQVKENINISEVKLWRNRLRLDGWMKYLFLISLGIGLVVSIYNYGWDYFLARGTLYKSVIWTILWFILLYYAKYLPNSFQELMSSNRGIFKQDSEYENYMRYAKKKFSSPIEKYLGFTLGFIWAFAFFYIVSISKGFVIIIIEEQEVILEGLKIFTYLVQILCFCYCYFLLGVIGFSVLFMYIQYFMCINKLGTEQFPLHVTYTSIRSGSFHVIGNAIIKISIPLLLVSTLFGIFGLGNIFLFSGNEFYGFMEILGGVIVAIILAFLLYKDTIHVHNAIVSFKDQLVVSAIEDMEKKMNEENRDYSAVMKINEFIKEVESTSDWPFDPASIKKFALTFSTTVIPFVLSFFGLTDEDFPPIIAELLFN